MSRRVVHVIAPAPIGGAERVVHDLAASQRECGLDVRVVALAGAATDEPWLVRALRATDVPIDVVTTTPRAYRHEIDEIRRVLLRNPRPHIVHSHVYRADVLSWLAARRLPPALVSTVHGFSGGGIKNRLYERLDRWVLRRFDGVIAVSDDLRTELEIAGVPAGILGRVDNAFRPVRAVARDQARLELALSGSAPTIGWIGRLDGAKGPDVLLHALQRLSLDFVVVLIGDGVLRSRLEAQAAEGGLSNRVSFRGFVPDAARLLPAFDLVVMSSRTEGLPIVLLEAMAAGVPVVATGVGQIPAVTREGELATVIPPGDPDALAAAIGAALATPPDPAHLEDARRHVLERYGVEGWVVEVNRAYDRAARHRDLGRAVVP